MGTAKLSVSVDEALVSEVRNRVGERGVSAFVTRAVRHELERERLSDFLAELEAELGPPDEEMVAEAAAAFEKVEAVSGAARIQRVAKARRSSRRSAAG